MRPEVWIGAAATAYPEGGGFHWTYLNWALGCRSAGCDVVWLDAVPDDLSADEARARAADLERSLAPYGLGQAIALRTDSGDPLPPEVADGRVPLEAAADADLFLDMSYSPRSATGRFRRTALLDIDPGLLQIWLAVGELDLSDHDSYFTIGETVGRPGARFPDGGIPWRHTPPCVSLEHWPVADAEDDAAFTTVSSWHTPTDWVEWDGRSYINDKRSGFRPYLSLPERTEEQLELALCLAPDEAPEREDLTELGWSVVHSEAVASTPEDYQRYIQRSRGEFSCAKPSCRHLQNAWISDRTLCYLASGKPAVVEHTGPSELLDDQPGVLRFRSPDEAAEKLCEVSERYDEHCWGARTLAEDVFDARVVAGDVLEQALA